MVAQTVKSSEISDKDYLLGVMDRTLTEFNREVKRTDITVARQQWLKKRIRILTRNLKRVGDTDSSLVNAVDVLLTKSFRYDLERSNRDYDLIIELGPSSDSHDINQLERPRVKNFALVNLRLNPRAVVFTRFGRSCSDGDGQRQAWVYFIGGDELKELLPSKNKVVKLRSIFDS